MSPKMMPAWLDVVFPPAAMGAIARGEYVSPTIVIDDRQAAPQRRADRRWRVQAVRGAERSAEAEVQVLLRLGDLLHVRAFILRGFVTVQVPDPDPVAGRGERAGQRL